MTLKTRLYILIGLFIAIVAIDFISMEKIKNQSEAMHQNFISVEKFNSHLQALEKHELAFLLEPHTNHAQNYQTQSQAFLAEVAALKAQLDWMNPKDHQNLAALNESIQQHAKHFAKTLQSFEQGKLNGDLQERAELLAEAENINQLTENFENALASSLASQIDTLYVQAYLANGIAVLIALLLIVSGSRRALKSIASMEQFLGELTQNLRFNQKLEIQGKDEFSRIADQFNQTLQTIDQQLNEANQALNSLAKGQLNGPFQHSSTHGDFAELQQNLQITTRDLQQSFAQIQTSLQHISNGNFSHIENTQLPGVYGEVLTLACQSSENLQTVFTELNLVMSNVAEGFFTDRVKAHANGELQILKNNINLALDKLQTAIYETAEVMIAQGTGDLTRRVKGNYFGTLGILKEGANNTVSNTASLLSQSNYANLQLSEGAVQISKEISELAERTHEQAAAVEQTAASMEEITSTVKSTADNAKLANETAIESIKEAQEANSVVHNTISAMHEISAASSKISEITSLIDSIAFQTNLLALNAAVEAARAGDHGRGFQVVAGEVRNLAGKSADAAKEIRALIDNTVEKVNEGAKLAQASGDALELINGSIDKISGFVREISQTTNEQAQGVEQVNLAIAEIDKVTQQNAATVQKIEFDAQKITDFANQVQALSQAFKIDLQQISFNTAMQTGNFTFANARRAHRQWKGVVQAVVDGMDVDFNLGAATDHSQCALGQWFYGEQGKQLAHLPEMQEVEAHHIELHQTIKQILQAKDSNDVQRLETLFMQLGEQSDKVISALTRAEMAVAQSSPNSGVISLANKTKSTPAKASFKLLKQPTENDDAYETPACCAQHTHGNTLIQPKNSAHLNEDHWDEF